MDSIIQGISRETEKRRRKTNRGRRSVMEGVYGGAQYLRKKKDLGNAKEVLEEFEGRIKAEVRRQEKINMAEERNFRRGKLL